MSIFMRIKALTENKMITIAELERKADLGNGTIRRWDNPLPSADKLFKVAKILDVTLEYLLNGIESKKILDLRESLKQYLFLSIKNKGLEVSEKEVIAFQNTCQIKIMDYIDFIIEKNLPTL